MEIFVRLEADLSLHQDAQCYCVIIYMFILNFQKGFHFNIYYVFQKIKYFPWEFNFHLFA